MTPVRLESAVPRSRIKHSTTEPLRSFRFFILPINVKMPTSVGILTLTSRINTISECFKHEKKNVNIQYFSFYEHAVEISC